MTTAKLQRQRCCRCFTSATTCRTDPAKPTPPDDDGEKVVDAPETLLPWVEAARGCVPLRVSVEVVDLPRVSTVQQTFDCRLHIKLTWRTAWGTTKVSNDNGGRRIDPKTEWSPKLMFSNGISLTSKESALSIKSTGNGVQKSDRFTRVTKTWEVSGTFDEPMELQKFPLDMSKLHVNVRLVWPSTVCHGVNERQLRGQMPFLMEFYMPIFKLMPQFLLRPYGLRLATTAAHPMREFTGRLAFFQDPCSVNPEGFDSSWFFQTGDLECVPKSDDKVPTGEHKVHIRQCVASNDGIQNSTLSIVLVAQRSVAFYIVNIVVPTFVLVCLTFISLEFEPGDLGERLQLLLAAARLQLLKVTLTILTLTAFKFAINQYIVEALLMVSAIAVQNWLSFKLYAAVEWFDLVSGIVVASLWAFFNLQWVRTIIHLARRHAFADRSPRFWLKDGRRAGRVADQDPGFWDVRKPKEE
ncbi:hypothetical protein FOA52_000219 [Chlamydomonas sp. UWO 241]|nr:hypothetical protein FOA52_000219 [Chlamydomonas sp. UWO 241]